MFRSMELARAPLPREVRHHHHRWRWLRCCCYTWPPWRMQALNSGASSTYTLSKPARAPRVQLVAASYGADSQVVPSCRHQQAMAVSASDQYEGELSMSLIECCARCSGCVNDMCTCYVCGRAVGSAGVRLLESRRWQRMNAQERRNPSSVWRLEPLRVVALP
jgi:hypothetical protein